MTKRLRWFLAGAVLFWLIVVVPARWLGGDAAVIYSSVALGLCLLPTLATLAWGRWALARSPEQQLLMVLGGTVLRMGFVLGASLALTYTVPYFQQSSFWIWVLVFYLCTLALEMAILISGGTVPAAASSGVPTGPSATKPEQEMVR